MENQKNEAVQTWRKGQATLATKETCPPTYEVVLPSGERVSFGTTHPWDFREDLTEEQRDLLQSFEWGSSGIVPDGDGWLIYDTSGGARFDFDPRTLMGPMTAFPIPHPSEV